MNPLLEDMPVVDAHHHFWDPVAHYYPWLCDEPRQLHRYGDLAPICRRYAPAEYLSNTAAFNITGTVYVEAEWNPRDPVGEMRYIDALRAESGFPSVAVAQAWLDHTDVQQTLEQQAAFSFVRGIRQKPRANASASSAAPGGMADASWRAGFSLLSGLGLSYDLQTPWWHLHEAAALARDFPDTQIIVNHAGMPSDRSADGLTGWSQAMAAVASCPNVAVKISGIGLSGRRWSADDHRAVVLTTIDLFGAGRCMFGSNFPVDSLCGSFDDIFGGFASIVQDFSLLEQQQLFHDNAMRIYAIPVL